MPAPGRICLEVLQGASVQRTSLVLDVRMEMMPNELWVPQATERVIVVRVCGSPTYGQTGGLEDTRNHRGKLKVSRDTNSWGGQGLKGFWVPLQME